MSIWQCVCSHAPALGRRDGFAWGNLICFAGEGVGKKIHQQCTIMDLKIEGGGSSGKGVLVSAFHGPVCLAPPTWVPQGSGCLSASGRDLGKGRSRKGR